VKTTAGEGWLTDVAPSIGGAVTGTVIYTASDGSTWPFTYTGSITGSAPFTSYQTAPGLP
jgi:hypothetical protein